VPLHKIVFKGWLFTNLKQVLPILNRECQGNKDITPEMQKMIEERMKKMFEKTFILNFDKTASIYKEEEKLRYSWARARRF
jgi:radical SAM superfamily enzyme